MISILSIIILAVMAVAIAWQLIVGLRPMRSAGACTTACTTGVPPVGSSAGFQTEGSSAGFQPVLSDSGSAGFQPVSLPTAKSLTVVVFASCDEEVLDRWISRVLEQDYPAFDVVVVYDANAENTATLAERYADEKRLYFTFIPPGSHTLNRRKLALTIGIKAAKSDFILTTIPQVDIPSDNWISSMMAPINDASDAGRTEVVLGFSHFDFERFAALSRLKAKIGTVTEGARWVGDAIAHRTWRGDGNNLIFKRSLFFENKGFADGLLLEGGDDDIFVNRIATPDNTAVVVSPETVLTVDWGVATPRVWELSRKRYRSTRELMPARPRTMRTLCCLFSWLMLPAAVGAAAASCFAWLPDVIAGFLILVFYILELIFYRRAQDRLIPTV